MSFQRGTEHPEAKLNEDIVRWVRRMRAQGVRENELAALLNVDDATIGSVVHRRNWKWVDDDR